jgi:hypothetical protein
MTPPRNMTRACARRVLVTSALVCFAAAIVLTPSGARSQLALPQREATEAAAHAEPPLVAIVPAGDAFAPRANLDEELHPAVLPKPPMPLPQLPRMPQTALQLPVAQPPPARVTAVATGSLPSAIVDDGGTARIVTIGDSLDGSVVSAISEDGIHLLNGRHLSLEPGTPAP